MKPRRPPNSPPAPTPSPPALERPEGSDGPAAKAAPSSRPKVCTAVKDLPQKAQELVRQMLIEGATFEDVVETINEHGAKRITLHAVQNYFRPDLSLQKERVKHLIEVAQSLKQAMGDPKSGKQNLVDAVLMTG